MRDASVFVWRGEGREPFRIRNYMDAYFFKNQGQNSPFSKISGYVLTGPEATIALSFRLKNIYQKCDAKQFFFFSFFLLIKPFLFLSFSSPSSSSWLLELAGSVTTETSECTILDMRRRISLKKRLFDGKRASKTTSAGTHRETPNW